MLLATPGLVNLDILILGIVGIGCAACSAAVVNHIVDERIDAVMERTQRRPMPQGHMTIRKAVVFAASLALASMIILGFFINVLTAILTLLGLVGYAFIYTMYLKHATPQNIVIGGLSGALPPLLGWTCVTNSIELEAGLLVLIIFTWTPAHFWPLAIDRYEDYKNAKVPMLPVTHGIEYTKSFVLFYTIALILISLLPFVIGMSGPVYLASALVLGGWFLYHTLVLKFAPKPKTAIKTFYVSINYLFGLFMALTIDHYIPPLI
jgi:protoheme IX farnesyltransferase